jgi:hypothetical protein
MKQRVMSLRYRGNMMSPTVTPESFWPTVETPEKQIEVGKVLYRSAGLARTGSPARSARHRSNGPESADCRTPAEAPAKRRRQCW